MYAYIEAKHTLHLDGTGGQSLAKAVEQVAAVKPLPRPRVPLSRISRHVTVPGNPSPPAFWPDHWNPMFGMILARHVRRSAAGAAESSAELSRVLSARALAISGVGSALDVIVAGPDLVSVPVAGTQVESPFLVPGQTLATCLTSGKSVGAGLCVLCWAIDWITLGSLYWPGILAGALGVPLSRDESEPRP
ncbi:MAG TPA: hypothetical protein VGD56_03450 [Gemmatirosa sp.]